jgi:phosphoglucosamine mutase
MGCAFATLLGNEGEVLVGMDLRPQSSVIYESVTSGLIEGGVRVLEGGILPTPALIHAQKEMNPKGALMVTGSHTPPPITGLLFFQEDAGESDIDFELRLERLYFSDSLRHSTISRPGRREKVDALSIYINKMSKILSGKFDGSVLAFDPGNGCMCRIGKRLFEAAGCKIHVINDSPDGSFPGRSPYPRPENLTELRRLTLSVGADFGVGSDGDGDRAIFVTGSGRVLMGDISGALFASSELKKTNGTIVAPINSSRAINHVCAVYGAKLVSTRVGPPAIVEAIRKNPDTIFAFEETGKYIWPEVLLYGDSVFSTLKMVETLRNSGDTLDGLLRQLPRLYMEKRMFRCKEEMKDRILMRAYLQCTKEFRGASVSTLDGVKLEFEDGSWLLLRPSGTESYFRCYSEGSSRSRAMELAKKGMGILKKAAE